MKQNAELIIPVEEGEAQKGKGSSLLLATMVASAAVIAGYCLAKRTPKKQAPAPITEAEVIELGRS